MIGLVLLLTLFDFVFVGENNNVAQRMGESVCGLNVPNNIGQRRLERSQSQTQTRHTIEEHPPHWLARFKVGDKGTLVIA